MPQLYVTVGLAFKFKDDPVRGSIEKKGNRDMRPLTPVVNRRALEQNAVNI